MRGVQGWPIGVVAKSHPSLVTRIRDTVTARIEDTVTEAQPRLNGLIPSLEQQDPTMKVMVSLLGWPEDRDMAVAMVTTVTLGAADVDLVAQEPVIILMAHIEMATNG